MRLRCTRHVVRAAGMDKGVVGSATSIDIYSIRKAHFTNNTMIGMPNTAISIT